MLTIEAATSFSGQSAGAVPPLRSVHQRGDSPIGCPSVGALTRGTQISAIVAATLPISSKIGEKPMKSMVRNRSRSGCAIALPVLCAGLRSDRSG
jgi:hypothetical protein